MLTFCRFPRGFQAQEMKKTYSKYPWFDILWKTSGNLSGRMLLSVLLEVLLSTLTCILTKMICSCGE
jgi:hypothetical protein